MSIRHVVLLRLHWINLPTALLLALLQRTPVLRLALPFFENVFESSPGVLLKSVVGSAAALGAVQTLAGATTLVTTTASPLNATTGNAVSVAFGVSGTQTAPLSWSVSGDLPPGVALYNVSSGGTGAGVGTVNTSGTLYLRGTPTTAGTYNLSLRAWQGANATLIGSPTFSYQVIVTGSTIATAPSITTQPSPQTVTIGGSVTFSVTAAGSTPLSYQWLKGGGSIAGATNASYTINPVQAADAGSYSVTVTNSAGSVTSATASLTVSTGAGNSPIVFTQQPESQTLPPGWPVTFTAVATSTAGTVSYQWMRDGGAIGGATSNTLSFASIGPSDATDYTVVATAGGSSVTSRLARLVVATPDPGRIVNMSVRAVAGSGGQPLIVGLVMSGGGKPVLMRAIGPGLIPFGVPGTMADPKIELHASVNGVDTVLDSNDNWGDNGGAAALSAAFASAGAFGLTDTTSKDAALVDTVDGARTVLVNSANGVQGVVLVEGYDDGSGNAQHLINISARNQVGTGGNILIAGFVINGNTPKKVLVRGIGPRLTDFGVTGVLADPKLEVHTTINQQDVVVATNDNWNDEPGVPAATTAAGAFTLNDGSKDAVVVLTLPAGAYTAQVSGVNGTTGNALVEVYEVP